MLIGLPPLLGPEMLFTLRAMGHGDTLVLSDTNFPADSIARQTVLGEVLRMENLTCAQAVEAVLSLLPPLADALAGAFRPAPGGSWCEWKGQASYLDVVGGDQVAEGAAWTYPSPTPGFVDLLDHVSLYPGRMDRCTVDGEVVRAQEGGFYGGWVTDAVVGPFKGAPGSLGW